MRCAAPPPARATARIQPIASFYRVRLMLAQMVAVPLTMFCLLGLAPRIGLAVVALLLGTLWRAEHRLSIRSPLTRASTLLACVLLVLEYQGKLEAISIYVPAAFFGVLLLVSGNCLLRGRPASMAYGSGMGMTSLHWKTSTSWVVVYGAGLLVSLVLPLKPGLFWMLPTLTLAGVVMTLWLQFVDMGPSHRRARRVQVGDIRIEELEPNETALRPFYAHYVREVTHSLRQGCIGRQLSFEELLRLKLEADAAMWPRQRFFAAYDGQDMIGTISCDRRMRGTTLGVESVVSQPLNLDRAAAFGDVMEIARFTIQPAYRLRPDVFRGLLGVVIDYAVEQDVSLLVTQSYSSACAVYTKIGFIQLTRTPVHVKDTGAQVHMLAFNLARRIVCEHGDEPGSFRLAGILNTYLCERYFKRQSLRSLFNRKRAWTLGDDQLAALCLGTPSTLPPSAVQHAA